MALTELWLPILVSAVFVFLVSSVIHMAIPIHKNDWSKMPGEEEVCWPVCGRKVSLRASTCSRSATR